MQDVLSTFFINLGTGFLYKTNINNNLNSDRSIGTIRGQGRIAFVHLHIGATWLVQIYVHRLQCQIFGSIDKRGQYPDGENGRLWGGFGH